MATDAEKLSQLATGDVIIWQEGNEELSGSVRGFTLVRQDKVSSHHVLVEHDGHKEKPVALSNVLGRKREKGMNRGFISWK